MALLSAVKAGIFVVQASGNTGPSPKSISSFSPWILTVGAATHDRIYSNSILLGNNLTVAGVGLAREFLISFLLLPDSICLLMGQCEFSTFKIWELKILALLLLWTPFQVPYQHMSHMKEIYK